ncbi:hypothetical protein [Kribbella sp. NPDC004536]|uniref:hypothetical protein n=1 Tax=Kribbella sp. NPDC004536 TaxID=3364106 RepID=UPI00369646B0
MFRIRAIATGAAISVVSLAALLVVPSAQAAASATSITLSAPASGAYGSTIKLTGLVRKSGTTTGLSGATIYLQRSVHGRARYGNLLKGRTTSTGAYTFAVQQVSAYDYRVYFPGSSGHARAFSPVRYPVTTQVVAFDTITTTNATTGQLTATGRVVPTPPNGTLVYLQRYSKDSRTYVNQAIGRTTAGKATIVATRHGSVDAYRLLVAARGPFGAGVSTAKSFSHYVWRGAFTKSPVQVISSHVNTMQLVPQDPTKSTLEVTAYYSHLGPDIYLDDSGCIKASSKTSLIDVPRESVTVFLTSDDSAVGKTGSLPAGNHGELKLDLDISKHPGLKYYETSNDATHFNLELQLLCNN